jgi:hypothetical protein
MRMLAIVLLISGSISGCATLVNSDRQLVRFKGGLEKGVTKVSTPDGTFEVENGSGSFMMTRTKADIPIKIMCPNGETRNDIVETRFDWLKGGVGNIFNYGWGWFVDPFVDDAYNISSVSLMGKCKDETKAAVAN